MTYFRYSVLINWGLLLLTTGEGQTVAGVERPMMADPDTRLAAKCIQALTDVMVHDITSPPVASRSYVYSLIAFYEAVRPGDTVRGGVKVHPSFGGRLNELTPLPKPVPGQPYDWLVAGASAFYRTAYTFVFSKKIFQQSWDSIEQQLLRRPVSKEVYDRSVVYGQQVAAHILNWVVQDHYIHTRTLPRYTPGTSPGSWQQTGPEYMEAVEPHWDKIRPLTLSAAHQFTIPGPAAFGTPAYNKEVKEVYDTSLALTDNEAASARFWDCNPYAVQTVGHLMYSIKKISPGGHWIGITSEVVSRQRPADALYAYSLVGVALFDGFIAAWDEKYRTNYVRPITAIQQSISPTWQPLLQTPPFPEYPSAHSVISMASAEVLTALYSDGYHYTDSVENSFGLPARSFSSFFAAAGEAAMSRMYGGIHFREAVVNGEEMGRAVGRQIVAMLAVGRVNE